MAAQQSAGSIHTSSHSEHVVGVLLKRYGRTYCDELGIDIASNTPSALFRWLCVTVLFSTRISASLALRAARALAEHGWTTPQKLLKPTWEERTRVLNEAGYARYDESTSTKLASVAETLVEDYRGDLRKLREKAQRDPALEHQLIQKFKGIGPVGADIFCRETQAAWAELYPFADKRALDAAKRLGIASTPRALSQLVDRKDFPRLAAALVRVSLQDKYAEIREQHLR